MSAWLSVVGIGEEGVAALAPVARARVAVADTLIGGARHLALVPEGRAERLVWRSPIADSIADIAARRGRRVVVLASGDPLCYGVGAMLARCFAPDEMIVLPAPSAFALAAARLTWPQDSCTAVSLHGRPLEQLRLHLAPGARILALSADGATPAAAAALLRAAGWGPSSLIVLEHMGGPRERRIDATAADFPAGPFADLNLLAIECRPGPGARAYSRLAGLPDDAFRHDGQITKREVRAATLAALAPLPGELLWDVGAGCGSVAIEWLRAGASMRAVAIERDPGRGALIAENAAALGVPWIEVVVGSAPAALAGLAAPDAVFLGGGVGDPTIFAAAWGALRPGGRLVANAVTLSGEAHLLALSERVGGILARLTVARADGLGGQRAFRPMLTVTQLALTKEGDRP
ncbi:MAG TPA: precorrin-6y C5,15-methyltransferase (decarboxylating) subunit CbiE [Stellaceae bacterium]|nr:precorrin-6y C5,15-methyltransferase (decarboxylating) subunit CbiE [Stellaceae bacterium]